MKLNSKNSIANALMVLILFSTIGFNIISTFCDGCEVEQTTIAITLPDDNLDCACCSVEEHTSCCTTGNHDTEHHHSDVTLAQLKFESREAESASLQFTIPVLLVYFSSILFDFGYPENWMAVKPIEQSAPPLSGRNILALICILRN